MTDAAYQTSEEAAKEAQAARELRQKIEAVAAMKGIRRPKVYRDKVDDLLRSVHAMLAVVSSSGGGGMVATRALVNAVSAVEAELKA